LGWRDDTASLDLSFNVRGESTAIVSVYHRLMYVQMNRLMNRSPDATAFILAGGKSTRMGRDKAFVEFEGRTLLARALELVASFTSDVQLDVRIVGEREKFAAFAPVVEDLFPEHGPLGGIHAALRASLTDLNVMLAVDMPFVPSTLLDYLIGHAREAPEAVAVVPRSDGSWQPLCAIYRRQFADVAETALQAGRNKIDPLFKLVHIRGIEEDELERAGFTNAVFRNLNTPEELEAQKRGLTA
jgi:molybdopterin-guanine dinucleotide biosynthesis protein A